MPGSAAAGGGGPGQRRAHCGVALRVPQHAREMAGWWEQLFVFMLRSFNQQLVMIVNLATDLFLVCCAGAVLGMVYFDSDTEEDLLQTVSLSCLVVGMTAITSSQRWFAKENAVFHREQCVPRASCAVACLPRGTEGGGRACG